VCWVPVSNSKAQILLLLSSFTVTSTEGLTATYTGFPETSGNIPPYTPDLWPSGIQALPLPTALIKIHKLFHLE